MQRLCDKHCTERQIVQSTYTGTEPASSVLVPPTFVEILLLCLVKFMPGFAIVVTVVRLLPRSTMVTTVATVMVVEIGIFSQAQNVRPMLSLVHLAWQPCEALPVVVAILESDDMPLPEAVILLVIDGAEMPVLYGTVTSLEIPDMIGTGRINTLEAASGCVW